MSTFPILDAFSFLRRELSLIYAAELKDSHLGLQQMIILFRLRDSDCTMSELSAFTQSDPAATSRTVAILEKSGLIRRTIDQNDARKVVIQLTSKGHDQSEYALRIRKKINNFLGDKLSVSERKKLLSLLNKVGAGLQSRRNK